MKKVFKITGITFLIIITLLIAIPFAFQGQIKGMIKRFINENVNAKVEFNDVSLSFLRSFPQAQVNLSGLTITTFKPFENETLVSAKSIAFAMPINELFKNADDAPITISAINIDEALVTLKTNTFGDNNYDITKADENTSNTAPKPNSFSFKLEDYSINKSALTYLDEGANTQIYVSELNHKGHGVFSAEASELDTNTGANISMTVDSLNYLNNIPVKLNALIGLDLNSSIYTFKKNKGYLNDLPLEFTGSFQQLKNGQNIDITFKNPESDFKNFLAVIPKTYSKNIENVETTGDFKVNGVIKGLVSETTIPHLDINISSNNASFKYPDLPKRVENISINTSIKNTTGYIDDTFVDIQKLNFKIDDDVFKSSIILKNLTKNISVNAKIDGILNLTNITKVYPIELDNALSGVLKGKIDTAFDMDALNTNTYERIKNKGAVSINDFVFSSEDIVNPIHISEANITFNPGTISLNNFSAKTGESDLHATGVIKNLLGFLLSDNKLQGEFKVNSELFKVSDFMTEDETTQESNKTTSDTESLKIPAFLDCTMYANAKTVVYDNLNLKDVQGTLLIKDQQATLKNMTSSLFDGSLAINGNVSTKNETPTFNLNLGANGFDISKSFKSLELLQNLAPIAKLFQGKLNTNIGIKGNLDSEFSPDLTSVSGNALAELLTSTINDTNKGALLNKLEGALGFIDFKKLNLKDLKTTLEFAEGKVVVKPFQLNYEDITIDISGAHSFDKTVAYNAIFNVPAKYLGSEVNQLIGRINTKEAQNITVPVTANIGGTYTSPTVKTDLVSGTTKLTKQLIKIEKQKLLNKGKDKVKNLIGDVIGGNKTKNDSLKQQQNSTVKNVLGSIIGGNKTDTTKTKTTKKTIKGAFNELLKNKKNK